MAKENKELTDKKHKIRRAFIISAIAVGVLTLGVGAMAMFSASPILIAIDVAVLAAAAFALVGTGVAINKLHDSSAVSNSKKTAIKTLEQIKQLNADRSSSKSQEYRAKIVRKFANANLVLSKRRGGTISGVFHSSSGIKNKKATEIINKIDAYTLLQETAKTKGEQKKYSKKIRLEEQKLSKIIEEEGVISSPYRWTKSYDNVVSGVSVLDRRTEIACLTSSARDEFAEMFKNSNEKTDVKALNIVLKFNESSNLTPTMVRAEDQTKLEELKEILLKDVVTACQSKTGLEVRSMFPITLEARIINKKTTKILNREVVTADSLTELKSLLEPERTA